jgi:surface protein
MTEVSSSILRTTGYPIPDVIPNGSDYIVTLVSGSGYLTLESKRDPNGFYTSSGNFASTTEVNMADRSLISGDFISAGYLGNNFISGSLVFTPSKDLPANEILVKIATFSTSSYVEIGSAVDPNLFITTWTTSADNEAITIPTSGIGYNYTVTTSDGRTFTNTTGDQTITFATAGDYDVSISGAFPRIAFSEGTGANAAKLIDIKQWGNIAWTNFTNAFRGCSNLVGTYTDAPDLSGVNTFNNAFRGCSVFTGKVSNWDVSNVTAMSGIFRLTSLFNSDLTGWDVSNVQRLNSSFQGATSFNQPIGVWDVGNVETFQLTFGTSNFDQDLSSWNIVKGADFVSFKTSGNAFSTANYNAILIGWEATLQAAYPNGSGYPNLGAGVTAGFGSSIFSGTNASASRSSLENTYNWTITDGGEA